MNAATPQLSVVIPVYNEGGNVRPLAEEIEQALCGRMRYEIVVVDDASTDSTPAEIVELRSVHPKLRSIRHPYNRGQSAAIRNGVQAARAAVVAVLDGDGQNDPADIPALFARLDMATNISMVAGERSQRRDRWIRRLSSRIANAVRARLLSDGIRDTGCGLKVFYREAYLELPAFDHMHRFLPALMLRQGYGVAIKPVNHRPRRCGESKYGIRNRLWAGIVDLIGVIWLQRRMLR